MRCNLPGYPLAGTLATKKTGHGGQAPVQRLRGEVQVS